MRRVHPLRAALWLVGGTLVLLAWTGGWLLLVHPRGRRLLVIALVIALGWFLLARAMDGAPVRLHAHPGRAMGVGHAPGRPAPAPGGRRLAGTGGTICRAGTAGPPPPGSCGDRWRRALRPNLMGNIVAPPSVSVQALQQALRAAGSPLANTRPRRNGDSYAEYLWDTGRRTGIDPAVVLAFFWVESHDGTQGVAVLTHNLANVRAVGTQSAQCTSDGCYAVVPDWFAGIDAIYSLLRWYAAAGLSTADQAIPVWAPSSDYNDVDSFRASVHQSLGELWMASQASRAGAP